MKVVLDTNVLLVSISKRSVYRIVFDWFLEEKINLCVSAEILYEQEEIIQLHMGDKIAKHIIGSITNAVNITMVSPDFKWRLLSDEDDNKFVDCAIKANAEYIVSNDRHFQVLKNIPFPKVEVLTLEEFIDKFAAILSRK